MMCLSSRPYRDRRDPVQERADRRVNAARGRDTRAASAADGRVRASAAEREQAAEALRLHAAAGRLDADELERRVEGAFGAKTRADLDALQADLPALVRRVPQPPRRGAGPALAALWAVFAVVAVVLLAVWALTGADAFWPAWPLGFWGAALLFKSPPWLLAGRRATPGRG
jgi:hypothetical protein